MLEEWFTIFRNVSIILANLMLLKYFVFMVVSPFYTFKEESRKLRILKHRERTYLPKISILVPAWNEEVGILNTIRSVLDNTYENIELIVINDGSDDNSDKVVKDFKKGEYKEKSKDEWKTKEFKYFMKVREGKGSALNFALKKATGSIIMTIDADSTLKNDAVANLVKYYADNSVDGVVGNVIVANNRSIMGITQYLEYLFGFYFKRAHAVLGAEYIFGGACASFRSSVFREIGVYDPDNKTEDIEFTMRFRYFGYNCTYAEDVICYTEGASEVLGLVRQRLRWKKGRIDTFAKYRRMFFSRDKRHKKTLTHFILPFSLLSEVQTFFEPISIALLLAYSFISMDFISIAFGILFIFVIYFITAIFNGKRINVGLLLLFPGTWVLFYFLVWVEFNALISTIVLTLKGEEVTWQRWERKGINS